MSNCERCVVNCPRKKASYNGQIFPRRLKMGEMLESVSDEEMRKINPKLVPIGSYRMQSTRMAYSDYDVNGNRIIIEV